MTLSRRWMTSVNLNPRGKLSAGPLLRVSWAAVLALGIAHADAVAQLPAQLDNYVEAAMAEWQVPGLALAVVRGDSNLWTRGWGVRRVGELGQVDENTLFSIASCSKAFAAASVAILVERGMVGWDDRVREHLPWFRLADPWVTEHATIRDLLGMRVGYSLYSENQLRLVVRDNREMVERSRFIEPRGDFRDRYMYSNNMYITIGALVEAVTGLTWEEFARREIWQPLGMKATHADVHRARAGANIAAPHLFKHGRPVPVSWEFPDSVAVPSGGINSTANDMASWVQFQLAQGSFAGRSLIAKDIFAEMHAPQSIIRDPERDVDQLSAKAPMQTHFWAYGMGWYVNDYRGRKMVWHSGTAAGHRAGVVLFPEDDLGIVVLVNKVPATLNFALAFWIADRILDLPPVDWSDRFLKEVRREASAEGSAGTQQRSMQALTARSPSLPLEQYAGRYQDQGRFGELVLTLHTGVLVATMGAFQGAVVHAGGDNFRFRWPDEVREAWTSAHFAVDETGRIRELRVEGIGVFHKLNESSSP